MAKSMNYYLNLIDGKCSNLKYDNPEAYFYEITKLRENGWNIEYGTKKDETDYTCCIATKVRDIKVS